MGCLESPASAQPVVPRAAVPPAARHTAAGYAHTGKTDGVGKSMPGLWWLLLLLLDGDSGPGAADKPM